MDHLGGVHVCAGQEWYGPNGGCGLTVVLLQILFFGLLLSGSLGMITEIEVGLDQTVALPKVSLSLSLSLPPSFTHSLTHLSHSFSSRVIRNFVLSNTCVTVPQ